MRICQQLQFTITIYNSNYINYKHFANMKGTLCKIGLPRGTEVKKKILNHCVVLWCIACLVKPSTTLLINAYIVFIINRKKS